MGDALVLVRRQPTRTLLHRCASDRGKRTPIRVRPLAVFVLHSPQHRRRCDAWHRGFGMEQPLRPFWRRRRWRLPNRALERTHSGMGTGGHPSRQPAGRQLHRQPRSLRPSADLPHPPIGDQPDGLARKQPCGFGHRHGRWGDAHRVPRERGERLGPRLLGL